MSPSHCFNADVGYNSSMQFHRAAAPFAVALVFVALFLSLAAASNAARPFLDPAFTFTAAGDFGGNANTSGVLNGIAAAGAQFHVTLGDLSYGAIAPETAWCDYIKGKVGATFPFELVGGNHDMDGQATGHINNFVTCLPDRIGNLTGAYGKEYYFDYQNLARVIFISPNLTLDGQLYTYNAGTTRYNWLVSAIDSARTASIPWVIVAMHKNCISTGVKSCEIGTDLFNLLISKKVDLVLQGHDHNYQRSKQLAFNSSCTMIVPTQYDAPCVNDDGADQSYPKGGGMLLMIAGTGGASLYPSNPADTEAGYFARFFVPSADTPSYGFLKINVTAAQLSGQFVATSAGATFTDAFHIGGSPPPTATPSPTPNTTTLIAKNSAWKYLDNGSNQGTAWRAKGFDDSAWASGNGQLGYGDGDESTTLSYGPNANAKYVTSYFRKTFSVANPGNVSTLTLKLLRDDGAAVYLNGTPVATSNMPGTYAYNTYAPAVIGGADESTYFTFNLATTPLQKGQEKIEALNGVNVLAVEVHQANATSSDVSFDAELGFASAPTATSIAKFTAQAVTAARVRVKWHTASEATLVGFNLWRSPRAKQSFEKINPALIPAQYTGQIRGASYRFQDSGITSGKKYFYRLEILHADDSIEWSDVVFVKVP